MSLPLQTLVFIRRTSVTFACVFWLGLLASVACAKDIYSIDRSAELSTLLAPPPALNSEIQKTELAELHQWQQTRTAEMVAYAQADQKINVFRFADILGAQFTSANLPLTDALFVKAINTSELLTKEAKKFFNRPRPFVSDTSLKPTLDHPPNASYPSGHSTGGNLFAILLANMIPEKSAEIFARGQAFAQNRVIGGVHYPSDIAAGRICATIVADRLFANPDFQKDFAAAKAELRRQLGLKP